MLRNDYEPEHFNSMRAELQPGDLTFDIGSYDATTSVLIGSRVGANNVVIIEPSEVNWANIQMNWRDSGMPTNPRACFTGFCDQEDKLGSREAVLVGKWPLECDHNPRPEQILEFRWLHYRNIDVNVEARPRLKIDTLAEIIGPPQGFTMDVEGAEFRALRGAEETLKIYRPLVWVSIHPQFMRERFNEDAQELHDFMARLLYAGKLLKADHEEHWFFKPSERV